MMPLEDTMKAIHAAEHARQRRMAEKQRLLRPLIELDRILADLEELHLRGAVKVSAAMAGRIEDFMRTVPGEVHCVFPIRTTIARVMDHLYAVQDGLLSRKNRHRAGLQEMDMALEMTIGADNSAA
jgi:hypothetical protein